MKTIDVVCGVIKDEKDRYLLTQRGDKDFFGIWEFPGGKVEKNEKYETSIKRELFEELSINIEPQQVLYTFVHEKEDLSINLIFIECLYFNEPIKLNEHLDYKWFTKKEMIKLSCHEGDQKFINYIQNV